MSRKIIIEMHKQGSTTNDIIKKLENLGYNNSFANRITNRVVKAIKKHK